MAAYRQVVFRPAVGTLGEGSLHELFMAAEREKLIDCDPQLHMKCRTTGRSPLWGGRAIPTDAADCHQVVGVQRLDMRRQILNPLLRLAHAHLSCMQCAGQHRCPAGSRC